MYTRKPLLLSLLLVLLVATACSSSAKGESAAQLGEKAASLIMAGKYDSALGYLDKAIELEPGNSGYWTNKALALAAMKRFDDALVSATTALQLDPKNAGAWSSKGSALQNLGRYVEALDSFNQALDLEPDASWIMSNKAAALQEFSTKGKPEDIKAFLNSDGRNTNSLFDKVVIQAAQGKYQDCALSSQDLVKLQPRNAVAWSLRGLCIMYADTTMAAIPFSDQHKEAVAAFEKVIELSSDETQIQTAKKLLGILQGTP